MPGRTLRLAPRTLPAIDIVGKAQTTALSVSGSVQVTGALAEGLYAVSCLEATCFIAVDATAGTADDVTTSTGFPLIQGNQVIVYVPQGYFLAAITAGAAGTLRIFRVE